MGKTIQTNKNWDLFKFLKKSILTRIAEVALVLGH